MSGLTFGSGRWSFTDCEGRGWHGMGFELNGLRASYPSEPQSGENLELCGKGDGWHETLTFTVDNDRQSLVIRRVITNVSQAPLVLESVEDGMLDADARVLVGHDDPYNLRYMHSSNLRLERLPSSCPTFPLIRPVPIKSVDLNLGEANDFPAFILTSEAKLSGGAGYPCLLVEGDLDQTLFTRQWRLGLGGEGVPGKLLRTYRGRECHPLSQAYSLAPGDSVQVSHVFYQIKDSTHPQDGYQDYVAELRRHHRFHGESSPLLHGAEFCTWNFGPEHRICEQSLTRRVLAMAERVPECTHFLVDAGYDRDATFANSLGSFYPDPAEGDNRKLFPRGMGHLARVIRKAGMVPAIWLSPMVLLDSRLAQERPDWLLRDHDGSPRLIGNSTYLDVSQPDAMQFLLAVFDTLFVDWGYRGLKFDFMTQWFTLERARFANGGSGNQWRDRVFSEIRRRIGEDGHLMTCIAASMGNPFPGLNADSYRCGHDVCHCTWREQVRACMMTLPMILLEGRRTFLLNMDSAGFGEGVPENEQLFRLTWVFITQGILEFGGEIENLPDHQIALLRRLCAHPDRGHRVRCLDEGAFTGNGLPEILKVDYPTDSRTYQRGIQSHMALFNWDDWGRPIGADRDHLGIHPDATITEFWSGAPVANTEYLVENLAPRSACLMEIARTSQSADAVSRTHQSSIPHR